MTMPSPSRWLSAIRRSAASPAADADAADDVAADADADVPAGDDPDDGPLAAQHLSWVARAPSVSLGISPVPMSPVPMSPAGAGPAAVGPAGAGPGSAADRGRPPRPRGRRLLGKVLLRAIGLTALAGILLISVPVPFIDNYLNAAAVQQVREQLAVPGSTLPPQVTIKGGRLLPQLLSRQLAEVDVVLADATIGGVQHANFSAVLRGVSAAGGGTSHADEVEASITVPFANLPATPGQARSEFARGPGGSFKVTILDDGGVADDVRSTVLLKLSVSGQQVAAVPQGMELFGQTLPPDRVKAVTGGTRTQKLPVLPAGLTYRSITPQADGLHVALGGVVTTPLTALPTMVGGRAVSYVAENGKLGIRTAVQAPPLINVPLTIFTTPRLTGGTLTLVPAFVRVLGRDRPPTDPIARIVLNQVKQQDLQRTLPALPRGVAYRSVSVDPAGVKVAVSGVTVRPLSEVSGGPAGGVFGARKGLLTAAYRGIPAGGADFPIVMLAEPKISGEQMVIEPRQFVILGTLFPAAAVLREVKIPTTRYPLQALPAGLAYRGVEVLPGALKIFISGKDVTLAKGGLFATAPATANATTALPAR